MSKPEPIKNPELKKAMEEARKNPGQESTIKLLNEVVRAKLLIPVSMDKNPEYDEKIDEIVLEKDTQISFELIKANNGDLYYPVFTDGAEMIRSDQIDIKEQHSMIVNFHDLAAMLLIPQSGVTGFSVNPLSDNVCFNRETVVAMKKAMEREDKQ